MGEDHIGGPLESFVIAAGESIALNRWAEQGADFCQHEFDVDDGVLLLVVQQLIDPNDQLRERMEPGEPAIVQDQLEELAGRIHTTVNAFVSHTLRFDERFVQVQEGSSQRLNLAPHLILYSRRVRATGHRHATIVALSWHNGDTRTDKII